MIEDPLKYKYILAAQLFPGTTRNNVLSFSGHVKFAFSHFWENIILVQLSCALKEQMHVGSMVPLPPELH